MPATPANAIDVSTSGAVSFNGTAFTGGTLSIANGGTNAASFGTTHGVVVYDGTSLVNYAGPQISTGGIATNTTQPAFFYYLASNNASVTGDYTGVQLGSTVALTQLFDNGSNCTTGGTFTAPVTGVYYFNARAQFSGVEAGTTDLFVNFVANSINYDTGIRLNYTSVLAAGNVVASSGSMLIQMTAAQTCVCKAGVGGGATKGVSINGTASPNIITYFSGYLVC